MEKQEVFFQKHVKLPSKGENCVGLNTLGLKGAWRTGALPSNFGNGSQRKRWNGQVTPWTMNTWAAAHQNAAVFMRNLGPLARAPRKVMRRKKRAVVIHTVYVATAKDGVVQP
uniref:E3 ubiquitin-protein ligase PPP1R11 isoform X2 n=1 Tax=Macaca mulatta TaxID=9544 RepID=UPI0010A1FE00|nr:E3 ubiquitin-protein ligase PPP1R11 isoform X2 [Macaca mulatta]